MLTPSWDVELSQALTRLASRQTPRPARIAVLGVGQDLRGDDGAGVAATRALRARLPAGGSVLVLDGGAAPESQTGALRRFQPALVLLVDAAELDDAPGSLHWLPWRATVGLSASSHTLPLHLLSEFLATSLPCEVALLGIQPADTTFGAPLSPAVAQAVEIAAARLANILS
jgi:hydrogenase 3 maturation protease